MILKKEKVDKKTSRSFQQLRGLDIPAEPKIFALERKREMRKGNMWLHPVQDFPS